MAILKDIEKRKEEIQQLIGADNLPKAMFRLMDFVRDFSSSSANLQKVVQYNIQFNQLQTVSNSIDEKETALVFQLLDFLDQVEEQVLNVAKKN